MKEAISQHKKMAMGKNPAPSKAAGSIPKFAKGGSALRGGVSEVLNSAPPPFEKPGSKIATLKAGGKVKKAWWVFSIDSLIGKIKSEQDRIAASLAGGNASNFEAYKFTTGEHSGLAKALEIIDQMLNDDDDIDL